MRIMGIGKFLHCAGYKNKRELPHTLPLLVLRQLCERSAVNHGSWTKSVHLNQGSTCCSFPLSLTFYKHWLTGAALLTVLMLALVDHAVGAPTSLPTEVPSGAGDEERTYLSESPLWTSLLDATHQHKQEVRTLKLKRSISISLLWYILTFQPCI